MNDRILLPGKLPPELLREVLETGAAPPPDLLLAPKLGEDAGVVKVSDGALVVASDPVTLTGAGVAAHAVLVNANDVAVMGARPRWFVATVLLPAGTTESAVRTLFAEMHQALKRFDIVLVGGHTEITPAVGQTVVVGQMMGLCRDGRFVRTGSMRAGDVVLQVGAAPIEGGAVLAQEARGRLHAVSPNLLTAAKRALHEPGIAVVDAALAATALGASAMHDPTEGGLSSGLYELADASGLALALEEDAVVWFEPACAVCAALDVDPWGVLASGTLLAAFPGALAERAKRALGERGYAVAAIARAEPGSGVRLRNGTALRRFERDEVARLLG